MKGEPAMTVKPLNDHVLVRPDPIEEVTMSGIILPGGKERGQTNIGAVIAVGPGKWSDGDGRRSPEVKVDDKVLFSKYAGSQVKLDDEEYLLLREDDILAVLSNAS